jgi:SAM-dependent methyltransferase
MNDGVTKFAIQGLDKGIKNLQQLGRKILSLIHKSYNMQERHKQRDQYFREQAYTSGKFVIPFIESSVPLTQETEVLEIGCGEGGNLVPFLDKGCKVTGVDILETKINNARTFYADHPLRENIEFICSDIYTPPEKLKKRFDLIIMRDVLEHIHNQERFLNYVKVFLKTEGKFFLGFPPWQNPFGGHQQMCVNKTLSKLPWIHLLPGQLYPALLRKGGEPEKRIESLLEIRDTRITIERFKRIIRKENYRIEKRELWFINPNYQVKFGLRPRKQLALINALPWFRNFMITTCYYLLSCSTESCRDKGD